MRFAFVTRLKCDQNLGKVVPYQLSYSRSEVLCDNFKHFKLERETRFELATSTLARLRSTN